jgi:hypothetical protein
MKRYGFKNSRLWADVVEAVQLSKENLTEVAEWCDGQVVAERNAIDPEITYVGLNLMTFSGVARATETNYIVKDTIGSFHVLEKHLFEDTMVALDE